MAVRSDILKSLKNYINDSDLTKGLNVKFNELKLDKDSMCLSVASDDTPGEVLDVIGRNASGSIKCELYYRVVSTVSGVDDLDSMSLLEDIVDSLREWEYVTDISEVTTYSWIVSPRLYKVYNGNIKDFVTKIEVNYIRRTN